MDAIVETVFSERMNQLVDLLGVAPRIDADSLLKPPRSKSTMGLLILGSRHEIV